MLLTKDEFKKYQSPNVQGFNRVPLMREVLADLDTPLSTYLKLARGPYSYLFESVQGGEKWGRYSIIGLPARTVLRVNGSEISVTENGKAVERASVADPLEFVRAFQARYRVPEIAGLPRFSGGLVGYFGYETIRFIEPRLGDMRKPDAVGAPVEEAATAMSRRTPLSKSIGSPLVLPPRSGGNVSSGPAMGPYDVGHRH